MRTQTTNRGADFTFPKKLKQPEIDGVDQGSILGLSDSGLKPCTLAFRLLIVGSGLDF